MAILLAMAVALFSAETPPPAAPELHQRTIYSSEANRVAATLKRGQTMLPAGATGFYRFRDPTQGVAILSHAGEVSGYLLKLAEGKSDKGLVLGYLFRDVSGSRGQLWFTTKQVHGIWYAFEGQIATKSGWRHSDQGDYSLQGTLTMHDESQQITRRDLVQLPFDGQP